MMKFNIILIFLLLTFSNLEKLIAQPQGETIDKIVAIVGNNKILYSEVESQYWQLVMQGSPQSDELRCSIFEELLLQKLLLNQAQIDSITVSESQVEGELDRRIRYFIYQLGSKEKLEEFYGKSVLEIKEEFRDLIRDQILIQTMQGKITENVKVTPAEVRRYFMGLHPDSIPLIESTYEIGQLVIVPQVSDEERAILKAKLEGLRERIVKGENFQAMAVLYSEDPGSSKKGGELGMFGRGEMFPEFEAAAFGLKTPGEVSPVIETKVGFHLLQLIERKGDYVNVRHILLISKASPIALFNTKLKLDSIYNDILAGKISFAEAVNKYGIENLQSQDGIMVNSYSGNSRFTAEELNQMDPSIFFTIEKLEVGQVSKPVAFQTEEGKDAYRLLYLKSRTKPHKANLEEDYNTIQEIALQKKKLKAMQQWVNEKKGNTYVKIMEEFQGCLFNYDWF